ncbi:MAG: hypothetical protein DWQ02_21840 [Bacteroidetes bacterium]|nr:MAG: hypothetical protein DWQ02_21840 [Bacteroidota bacterium]
MKNLSPIIFLALALFLASCDSNVNKEPKNTETVNSSSCIELTLKMDDSLGTVRNHACETISLSATIDQYVKELQSLDYKGCPDSFINSFDNHLDAWTKMIPLTDKYPGLRGEMHVLFDEIKAGTDSVEFNQKLKAIWDTWAEVEKFVK